MLSVRGNLLNSFFTDTILVIRRTYQINDYGENVMIESAPFVIKASVQPTPGKELQFLPDFALETETVTIYSNEMLYSENTSGYSDIVVFEGLRYQIIKSKRWKTHCEAVGMLEPYSE